MTLHLHCGASARNLRMYEDLQTCMLSHHHYQIYSLYANLEDIAPGLFWSLDLLWSIKAGTWHLTLWFVLWLQKILKVPASWPPQVLSNIWQSALTGISTGGNAECQAAQGGDGSAKDEEGILSLLQGFVTQLDEWKRQIPNNWRAFNSSYIWKTIYPHAHILQIRKLRLKEVSWFADLETGTQALTQIHVLSITVDSFNIMHTWT